MVHAINRGSSEMARELLQHGAKADYMIPDADWSLLHLATELFRDDSSLIRLLVSNGANINIRDFRGMTPLHIAVDVEADGAWQNREQPTASLTRLLLELGADATITDSKGRTPLDLARSYEHQEAIQALIDWQCQS
jgi:ankyrin repeat protein